MVKLYNKIIFKKVYDKIQSKVPLCLNFKGGPQVIKK